MVILLGDKWPLYVHSSGFNTYCDRFRICRSLRILWHYKDLSVWVRHIVGFTAFFGFLSKFFWIYETLLSCCMWGLDGKITHQCQKVSCTREFRRSQWSFREAVPHKVVSYTALMSYWESNIKATAVRESSVISLMVRSFLI